MPRSDAKASAAPFSIAAMPFDVILDRNDFNRDEFFFEVLFQRGLRCRAGNDSDPFIGQVGDRAKFQIGLGQQAAAVDKGHQTEINPFLARKRGCARAALDIHLA